MSPPEINSQDLYPNAKAIIQRITNLTKGEDCIFRGEPKLYDYPCSSGFYRELKNEGTATDDIPARLKEKQGELIVKLREEQSRWETDLERLMDHQHKGGTTNLLDFAGDLHVALFFACSQDKNSDGQVIVKRKGVFRELDRSATLADDEIVLLQPPDLLLRARDQRAVLLHVPNGTLPVETEETVLIKREFKEEILERLKKAHSVSTETMLRIGKQIEEQSEDTRQIASTPKSTSRLKGPEVLVDNKDIFVMEYYVRLLEIPLTGLYKELRRDYSQMLIESLTNTIKLVSHDAKAYYNRAFVHQTKPDPDYEQAISDYARAIKLNPGYVEAYNNRGIAYSTKPNPDYDKAISDYTSALGLNLDYAEAYSNRGNVYCKVSPPEYEKALKDYDRATELDPDLAMAYNNRGRTYAEMLPPNYEKALEDYHQAIEKNPDYTMAYYNRALAYQSKPEPDYPQAISDYDRAIELNPSLAIAYNDRGNVYAQMPRPDYDTAILDYDRAIELNPRYGIAYNNRGNAHREKPNPDYDTAILDYDRAIELAPSYEGARYNRGNAYMTKPNPDYDKAISDYTRALELKPGYAEAYRNRGNAYMKKFDPKRALPDHKRARELNPRLEGLLNERSLGLIIGAGEKTPILSNRYFRVWVRVGERICGLILWIPRKFSRKRQG